MAKHKHTDDEGYVTYYTDKELHNLKMHWSKDPIYDLHEGFEGATKDELVRFQNSLTAQRAREYKERVDSLAKRLVCSPALAEYIIELEDRIKSLEDK